MGTKRLNFDGPEFESLFHKRLPCIVDESTTELFQGRAQVLIEKIEPLKDDRLLAIVGELLVESALDELLSAIMPKMTEGMLAASVQQKINILRSLQLIPDKLLVIAKAIADIRNEFAHGLKIDSFSKCKTKKWKPLAGFLRGLAPEDPPPDSDADLFKSLVLYTSLGIHTYMYELSVLNLFLREGPLEQCLTQFVADEEQAWSELEAKNRSRRSE